MGVPSISENSTAAAHGDIADYRFDWSNQSAIARAGAVACHKVGGNAEDIVLYGETGYGEVIGPILSTSKDPTLTDYLPTDGTGCCGTSIGQRPGRTNYIVAGSSGAIAVGDLLIPTGAVGAVIPRPIGSVIPAVAKALQAVANSSSEQYIFAEILTPGGGGVGNRITGYGSDAPVNAKFLNAHYTTIANAAVPLFVCPAAGRIRDLFVKIKTAGGAGKTVTYTVQKSTNGGTSFADTTLTCGVVGTATTGSDTTHQPTVAAGDLLAIAITTADAGTADGPELATFRFE